MVAGVQRGGFRRGAGVLPNGSPTDQLGLGRPLVQPLPPRLVNHFSKTGEEGVGVHEVEERTGADAHEPYLDQRQKRAPHGPR